MALSAPRVSFGIHSVTPWSKTDGLPYGIMKVLDGSTLSLQGDIVELMGGSNKYSWAAEDGPIKADMSLKVKQFEDFMFTLFLGGAPTVNAAETSGNVATLANVKGTSCFNAVTGITTSTTLAGSEADQKFGKFIVKVVTSTTVDVYFLSDADIGRGANGTMQNDALKVTATTLTVVSGAPVTIPNFGVKLTGGSGAIGMTVGDTAVFYVRPNNTGSMTGTVGALADQVFPEFGALVMAQRRGNQEMWEFDVQRCKAAGMPLDLKMAAFNETEIKIKMLYDTTSDSLFSFRYVKPS